MLEHSALQSSEGVWWGVAELRSSRTFSSRSGAEPAISRHYRITDEQPSSIVKAFESELLLGECRLHLVNASKRSGPDASSRNRREARFLQRGHSTQVAPPHRGLTVSARRPVLSKAFRATQTFNLEDPTPAIHPPFPSFARSFGGVELQARGGFATQS